jgi:hypothetical protein
MSLRRTHARLSRLEHDAGMRGPCRVCRGRGWHTVAVTAGPVQIVAPRGCPGCGVIAAISHTILPADSGARPWPGADWKSDRACPASPAVGSKGGARWQP